MVKTWFCASPFSQSEYMTITNEAPWTPPREPGINKQTNKAHLCRQKSWHHWLSGRIRCDIHTHSSPLGWFCCWKDTPSRGWSPRGTWSSPPDKLQGDIERHRVGAELHSEFTIKYIKCSFQRAFHSTWQQHHCSLEAIVPKEACRSEAEPRAAQQAEMFASQPRESGRHVGVSRVQSCMKLSPLSWLTTATVLFTLNYDILEKNEQM